MVKTIIIQTGIIPPPQEEFFWLPDEGTAECEVTNLLWKVTKIRQYVKI